MENQREYLDEKKYQSTKKLLIIIGCVSLAIGIALFIGSLFINVPKMGEEGWFEAETTVSKLRGMASIVGLMIPVATFFLAFRREISAFSMQQSIPVVKEGMEKMSPTAGVVAKEIAKGVKEGLKDDENK